MRNLTNIEVNAVAGGRQWNSCIEKVTITDGQIKSDLYKCNPHLVLINTRDGMEAFHLAPTSFAAIDDRRRILEAAVTGYLYNANTLKHLGFSLGYDSGCGQRYFVNTKQ